MSDIATLTKKLDKIEEALEKSSKAKRTVESRTLFGGFGPSKDYHEWPAERLKRLSETYNSEAALHYLTKSHNGKPRGIGWGPALVKMAALAGGAQTGVSLPSGYTTENFEKEYNFTTIDKAAKTGVKGLTGEVRKTALAEGSGVTGGYTIPPQFMNELLTIAAEDAFIEPRSKVIPMTGRTATWPMLDVTTNQGTGVSPYFGGIVATWQPQAATINESEPQFRQSEWTAWDLVLYTVASNQLLADNGIGLDALLTQLFAQAFTWYKEYAFLNGLGSGSSMPLGVKNAPAAYVQSRTTSSKFKLPDAAAMMSRLHVRSWDDACWVMHQSVLPELIQMTNNATNSPFLVWLNPMGSGDEGPAAKKPVASLLGLPIFFTEKVPQLGTKGDVMLIDWSRYVIGNRLDLQIDVSPHYLFRNNQLAWRVVARCDGRPWLNNVITDANGWQSSPFVILNT